MRRRLILSTALIALAAVIVLGVPLGIVDAARLRQDETSRLEREADAVAGAIDDRLERGQQVTPALLRRFIPSVASHHGQDAGRAADHVRAADRRRHAEGARGRAARRVGHRRGADRRASTPASTARGC